MNNPQEKYIYQYGEKGLGNYYVQSMAESHDGTLYFGTSGSGIYRFDGKKEQFTACTDIDADYCYNMDTTYKGFPVTANQKSATFVDSREVQTLHINYLLLLGLWMINEKTMVVTDCQITFGGDIHQRLSGNQ